MHLLSDCLLDLATLQSNLKVFAEQLLLMLSSLGHHAGLYSLNAHGSDNVPWKQQAYQGTGVIFLFIFATS